MRMFKGAAFAVAASFFSITQAHAGAVDLSAVTNDDLNGPDYFHGTNYPGAGTTLTIGGVNFTLSSAGAGSTDTGTIQAGNTQSNDTGFLAVPNQANVGSIYAIINAAFPTPTDPSSPINIGVLNFTFDGGIVFDYDLLVGYNVRDHVTAVSSAFEQQAPNVYATANFGTDLRLDVQQIILPTAYQGLTLTGITLQNTDPSDGNPFLVALTTLDVGQSPAAAVPEPASWAMMLGGFGMIGGAMRARKRSVRFA